MGHSKVVERRRKNLLTKGTFELRINDSKEEENDECNNEDS